MVEFTVEQLGNTNVMKMRQGCVKDDSSLVLIDPVSNIRDYAIDSMATDCIEKIANHCILILNVSCPVVHHSMAGKI
jgi:hypothetical protein